jgi:tetratricopeptide (TPR) repeat protein
VNRAAFALLLLGSLGCGERTAGDGAHATPPPGSRTLAAELRPVARAIEERRFETGRELAQAYLVAHPQDAQAMFLLGLSYYWTGNYGAARPWLEQALARDPDIYVIHDYLGYSLFLLGELDAARREYEAFLAVVPREPKGHYELGLVELEETRLDAAAERFRHAIELYDELFRTDARQVAARQSEYAECHARLGEVYFARGDYPAARAELVRATTLCPGNISAFYTLSLVHRRLGEEELADQAAARYESARQALLASPKARQE